MSTITRHTPSERTYPGDGATGGVADLTTAGEQVSRMVWIPQFSCQSIHPDLGSGVHPAFIVNGSARAGFWAGMYPGTIVEGELLSIEGADPTVSTNFDQFSSAARACGPGWHMMTAAEWAAVTLWALKQGKLERGNDQYGRSYNAQGDRGRLQHGGPVGVSGIGHDRTINGSGPDSWRHDNTAEGIEGLVGNVWEWVAGMRTDENDIQIIPDNDAAIANLAADSTDWVSTGLHYTTPADGATATFRNAEAADGNDDPASGTDLTLLRRLALLPMSADLQSSRGTVYRTTVGGERLPLRGGLWILTSLAGWFALNLAGARSSTTSSLGARPAFVEL